MFTGIVEELGEVKTIKLQANSALLTIKATKILSDLAVGDSIAVNGVCLTVVNHTATAFTADVMGETLAKSTLGDLTSGSKVNLERALQLTTRLGGHLVSGHIDGTGHIKRSIKSGIAESIEIITSLSILKLIIPKGSIAIDGISLTVVDVTEHSFTVALIPHTFQATTLGFKGQGELVNLENDLIGKYVLHLLDHTHTTRSNSNIDLNFLSKHGFA
ncbi:MAG: riboflavin synthase [Peptococcaceae bacterium]|nr:riboflavin synthase [Peptococcaceae bacterium]